MVDVHTGGKMVKFSVYLGKDFYAAAVTMADARALAKSASVGGYTAEVTDTSGRTVFATFQNGEVR